VVRLLVLQPESCSFVDAARVHEHVVRPQHEPPIAAIAREPDTGRDEIAAHPESSCARLDQEEPQLCSSLVLADAEHRAEWFIATARDPHRLTVRVVVEQVPRHDVGDEGFEAEVPPVLLGIEGTLTLDHPTEIPWLGRCETDVARPVRRRGCA
jgi:hypothetical protein